MSHLKNMEKMMECLIEKAKAQLDSGIENVDTNEMYKVVDIIKDLADAKYKCTVVKAMEDADEDGELRDKIMELTSGEEMRFYNDFRNSQNRNVFSKKAKTGREYGDYFPIESDYPYYGTMPRYPKMYYTDGNGTNTTSNQMNESRYDRARRNYTESRKQHDKGTIEDKQANMDELESYMRTLSEDMTSMIKGASEEEKMMLRDKLNNLVARI